MIDRWDIVEGWYWFLTEYHGGQYSESYRRLCRLQEYYSPGHNHGVRGLTGGAREVYEHNVAKHYGTGHDGPIPWPDFLEDHP